MCLQTLSLEAEEQAPPPPAVGRSAGNAVQADRAIVCVPSEIGPVVRWLQSLPLGTLLLV